MPSAEFPLNQSAAWIPTPEHVADTNLARFWTRLGLADYAQLQAWALDDVGRFWDAVMDDLAIEFSQPYRQVLDVSGGIERPEWCVDGRMNIVHNCLDRWSGTEAWERDALRYESEEGETTSLTYRELHDRVQACAAGLRAYGLGPGDAVGLYLPMTPQIVIAFLAVARIGGVVLPLFSGYGVEAVATRLRDGNARALVVADGAPRRGRAIDMKGVADKALEEVPSVARVFVVDRMGDELVGTPPVPGRDVAWNDLMTVGGAASESGGCADTAAEDTVMLIYTSGTTGTPKGAVHTHCGFPIKAAQDMRHPMDVRPGDVVWWMSDMGWMMGPWLVFGTLLNGATMVLFDGAPDYPDPDRTWAMVERHGVTLLGVSPTLIRALMPHGRDAVERHDVSGLRSVGSTGSPWDPESWRWLFETVLGGTKPILNYSGGTEISGGIVCGNHVEPLKPTGFPGPVVGMDADVVDETGKPVRGAVGELAIRQPWIGMTRGFWGGADAEDSSADDASQRYLSSYWQQIPDLWVHGDFATIDSDGQWFLLGRSDDTIKVAGKRLGPAEVEAALNAAPEVLESAAVGVPDAVKGQAVVAFVVLADAASESEMLRGQLMMRVSDALGKALRPKAVLFSDSLPKTRNAKVMRRVIRAAHLRADLGNVTALEDETAVDAIQKAR